MKFGVALASLLVLFCLTLTIGAAPIPLADVVRVLVDPFQDSAYGKIVWQFRLPQSITAVLAGSALSVSGLQMQTLFRNPLADPFVLGITAGAGLGVGVVVLAGGGDVGVVVGAGGGALLTLLLLLIFAPIVRNSTTLLVFGLLLGYITNGIISILFQFTNNDRLRSYVNWTLGSFSTVTWGQIPLLLGTVAIGSLIALALAPALNTLLLGENQARSLGTPVTKVRLGVLISTALLTGSITAFCGPIAFIGVAVPHLCRYLWRTAEHRQLLIAVVLFGSSLSLLADMGTKVLGNGVILPLNGLTALLSVPVMGWVVLSRSSGGDGQKWYL